MEVVRLSLLRFLILFGFIDNFEYRLNLELIEFWPEYDHRASQRRAVFRQIIDC